MRLAGTYHPIAYLLQRLPLYLPGVESIEAIWCDENDDIRSTYSSKIATGEVKATFQDWRKKKFKTQWLEKFDPFHFDTSSNRQMSLNDEDRLDTLLLYFNSPFDKLSDIIAIQFPKTLFLKNFNVAFSGISVQEKQVLTNLLSSVLHTEHEKCIEERMMFEHLQTHQSAQQAKIRSLEDQLKTSEHLYSSAISTIIKDLTKEYEPEYNCRFIVDEAIVKYYAREKSSLSAIRSSMERVISLAYHMNINSKEIHIDDSYVSIAKFKNEETSNKLHAPQANDRILDLLDRYENAALKTENDRTNLNAKEIAYRMDPPITPPAITDAVKKNKQKIAYLLRQYPDRWLLVRKAIRPIRRLDKKNTTENRFIS